MQLLRIFLCAILAQSLIACQTLKMGDPWPTNMPAKQRFVQDYLTKFDSPPTEKELETQLSWVVRFYQGTAVYPGGWLKVSNQFLNTIDEQTRKQQATRNLEEIGIQISNEWARANSVRLINNRNIVIWGNGLRTASQRNEHELYLKKVASDVIQILDGKLLAKEITYERYYSEQDIEDEF